MTQPAQAYRDYLRQEYEMENTIPAEFCGNKFQHKAHTWHKIWDTNKNCPGQPDPYTPPPQEPDCCAGFADLCPLHASAATLAAALKALVDEHIQGCRHWPNPCNNEDTARAALKEAGL